MTITIETFKEATEYLTSKGFAIHFETKKNCIEWQMQFNENGRFEEPDYDFPTYIYVSGKRYESDEITLALARKAECIILAWETGWTFYIGRTCTNATLQDAYENSLDWYVENEEDWESLEAEAEQEAQEAQEAEQEAEEAEQEAEEAEQEAEEAEQEATDEHHTIYTDCTPCYTPTFAYDISHARTEAEQQAIIERATQPTDAPASETAEEESWFCGCTTTPIDPDTANQEADTAALTREAEDRLYQECAAQQAAEKAKRRPIASFIITLIILIVCTFSAGTIAHALTTTAPALTDATAITGDTDMATRIPAQKQTTTTTPTTAPTTTAPTTPAATTTTATAPTTPAATTTTAPTTPAATTTATAPTATAPTTTAPTTTAPTTPTLAQLLARALEAQKDAKTAPQTPAETQTTKETLSLKTALKRALMAPKTGTTECVIYSTLYAAIRIEEVTTAAPAPKDAAEEAEQAADDQESKSLWTIAMDMRRIAFMRELRNVARGRAYCENITSLLKAIDQSDDDYLWHIPAFTGLDDDLKKALKGQFEAKECTDAEREECRAALDPHAERVTLHQAAIETAAEALARTAPEWSPLIYEETPAPATLRQAILELQYCIFPIDSSPRARVFRGLEGIDFKTLSTPEDYKAACKAASLRAGEPSTAIPPEARARIIQWRSGSVTTSPAAVTSTAARLAAVWGMD